LISKAIEDYSFNRLFPFLGWWVGKDNKISQPHTVGVGAVWRDKCVSEIGVIFVLMT